MLKTLIFFLFGCSLYFGQSTTITGSQSKPNEGVVNRNTIEGDGTRASNSGGGSGTNPTTAVIFTQLIGSDLRVYLNQPDKTFNKYIIYDRSGNVKKNQTIRATNSHLVDISNLDAGYYLIYLELTEENIGITKPFIKP